MTEQNRQESIRPLPPVGRARGFLDVWQQMKREAEMRFRRGYLVLSCSYPCQGRVATLALYCEAVSQNAARTLNPIPHQRRGRGEDCILSFLTTPTFPLAWEEPGVETLALTHSWIPPCKSLIHGPNVFVHKEIFPIPLGPPPLEAPSGP